MRALLCNFMINLAMLMVYNGIIKSDVMKAVAMVSTVFVFAFVGLEHSVANTVLFTIVGLHDGIDIGLALGNVAIVLVGNFIGGGLAHRVCTTRTPTTIGNICANAAPVNRLTSWR